MVVKNTGESLNLGFNVSSSLVSANGNYLYTGTFRKGLWRLDLKQHPLTPEQIATSKELLTGLRQSPDGRYLAAAGVDRLVRLWDLTSESPETKTLDGHSAIVNSAVFTDDGRYLLSAGTDSDVIAWRLFEEDGLPKLDQLCGTVTRNLSDVEWREDLPEIAYECTCGSIAIDHQCPKALDDSPPSPWLTARAAGFLSTLSERVLSLLNPGNKP